MTKILSIAFVFATVVAQPVLANAQNSHKVDNPTQLESTKGDAMAKQQKIKDDISTLWISVTALMIGADVLSLHIPASVQEFKDLAGGNEQWFMLMGAAIYMMPVSMIMLSKWLPRGANRIVNIGAATLISLSVIAGGSLQPHYVAIAAAEIALMSAIVVKSIYWTKPEE